MKTETAPDENVYCSGCDSYPCICCAACFGGAPCVCDAPCCLCGEDPCRCEWWDALADRIAVEDAAEEAEEERREPGIAAKRRLAQSILLDPDFRLTRDNIIEVEEMIFGKASRS